MHDDGGSLHADARVHEHAAHGREPDGSRTGKFLSAEPMADAGARDPAAAGDPRCVALRDDERREKRCGSTTRSARSRQARKPTSSFLDAEAINVAPLNQFQERWFR
jgi:hypothetical protein